MAWRSRDTLPLKQERAETLLLALAALLLRGGERVRGFGAPRAFIGRAALTPLAGRSARRRRFPVPAPSRSPRNRGFARRPKPSPGVRV